MNRADGFDLPYLIIIAGKSDNDKHKAYYQLLFELREEDKDFEKIGQSFPAIFDM